MNGSSVEALNRTINDRKSCSPAVKWFLIMIAATGVAFLAGIGGAFALHKTGIIGAASPPPSPPAATPPIVGVPKICTTKIGGQVIGELDGKPSLTVCDLGRTAHRLTDLRPGNLYELGAHSPTIKTMWFNPDDKGIDPLPRSQTHEVFFHQPSRSAYMSNYGLGLLLNVSFDEVGNLIPEAQTWLLNTDSSGVHHVGNGNSDGLIWISTQHDGHIHMVDPRNFLSKARYSLKVPTTMTDSTGKNVGIGEPHSVVPDKSRSDGTVWVTLKGGAPKDMTPKGIAPEVYYAEAADGLVPPLVFPEDQKWAVWRIAPTEYGTTKGKAYGGALYEAEVSPGMSAVDQFGNSFHAQDATPKVLYIPAGREPGHETVEQIPLPDNTDKARATGDDGYLFNAGGPSVVASPSGGVWLCSLTMERGWMMYFAPNSKNITIPIKLDEIFKVQDEQRVAKFKAAGGGDDFKIKRRIIHMQFSSHGGPNFDKKFMYLLSSSIASTADTRETVIVLEMNNDFSGLKPGGIRREVLLSAKAGAVHRMSVAEMVGVPAFKRSLLVSGLTANCLYQIPLDVLEA